ncbi:hypothetical protein [Arthrobacter sp. SLBN-100]|uniref:hypothetical protein n=1 Tax=Arthrobacter sp. SLBN-100 TaxID=2768450 RepID=UPI001F1867F7|nr:hypothetical protein [Arthrobacter sp. SLBN-100]
MKKTVIAVVLAATAMFSTGCAAEAVTGALAEQAAQGSSGQPAGTVDAMTKAKERIEAKAYTSRVVAEHESMMAGEDWIVTGGGWTRGAVVTVTLEAADGTAVGAPVEAVADAEGHIDAVITIPEGTTTGTYTLVAADGTGKHSTTVNIFSN